MDNKHRIPGRVVRTLTSPRGSSRSSRDLLRDLLSTFTTPTPSVRFDSVSRAYPFLFFPFFSSVTFFFLVFTSFSMILRFPFLFRFYSFLSFYHRLLGLFTRFPFSLFYNFFFFSDSTVHAFSTPFLLFTIFLNILLF